MMKSQPIKVGFLGCGTCSKEIRPAMLPSQVAVMKGGTTGIKVFYPLLIILKGEF